LSVSAFADARVFPISVVISSATVSRSASTTSAAARSQPARCSGDVRR
jgi:hypothetical protein